MMVTTTTASKTRMARITLPQAPLSSKTTTATDATVDCASGGEAEDAVPDFLDARTRSFGTKDASGLTSQAANFIEALKSSALALLVDKDVSAANFMARDGRMRTMIMDEPIMPLLYRVNGLFLSKEHGSSTVVVGLSHLKIYRDADNNNGRAEDQNDAASKEDDGDEDKHDGMTDMSKACNSWAVAAHPSNCMDAVYAYFG